MVHSLVEPDVLFERSLVDYQQWLDQAGPYWYY
jgi:hypothetical protein